MFEGAVTAFGCIAPPFPMPTIYLALRKRFQTFFAAIFMRHSIVQPKGQVRVGNRTSSLLVCFPPLCLCSC